MQKKGFGKAIIIGVVSGVVAATAAAYFFWEAAKKYAYQVHAWQQAQAISEKTPKKNPQTGTLVAKYEKNSQYNANSGLEPLAANVPVVTQTKEIQPEKLDIPKSAQPAEQPVAPQKKSRRKRKRKKLMVEEVQPSVESSEQLQKVNESITVAPAIGSPVQQSPIAEPVLKQSNTESAVPHLPTPRTLHVHNNIPLESLQVKHWTGTYTPTKLTITINGVLFTIVGDHATPQDATHDIVCSDDGCINVEYVYEFMNGMRTGTDTIVYSAPETAQDLHLRFSWDTAWHVELDGAQRKESVS